MNNRNGRRIGLMAVAMLAGALLTGCVTDLPTGQKPLTLENFKPYEMNLAQRAMLTATTQYMDRVITNTVTVTNTAVFVITNTVVVEKPVIQQVAGVTVTNFVPLVTTQLDTQAVQRVEQMLSTLTIRIPTNIDVAPRAAVSALTGFTSLIPGYGQLAGAGLLGGLSLFAGYTRRKLNESNAAKNVLDGQLVDAQDEAAAHKDTAVALSQGIQVARNLLDTYLNTTPQGQMVAANYTKWLKEHQEAAGVLGNVVDNVLPEIDDKNAQYIALELAGKIPPMRAA